MLVINLGAPLLFWILPFMQFANVFFCYGFMAVFVGNASHFLFLFYSYYCGRSSRSRLRHPPHRPPRSLCSPHQEERRRKLRPGQDAHLQESSHCRNLRMSILTHSYLLCLSLSLLNYKLTRCLGPTGRRQPLTYHENRRRTSQIIYSDWTFALKSEWMEEDRVCCQTARFLSFCSHTLSVLLPLCHVAHCLHFFLF